MLQLIRGNVGSWFIKILFGFLILSFAVWGIGDIFRGGGVRASVATVGDERIPVQRLVEAFQAELGRLQQIFGPTLDVQLALNIGLLDQAMDGLVTESLFNQAAGSLGVRTPDQVIKTAIEEEPLFQDGSGQFSREQFNRFLRASGRDESAYLASRRQDLSRQGLVSAISAGATIPDTLAEALHRYRNETRHIAAILIESDTVGDVAPPTEEQVEDFYREREPDFMAPEYRVLRVVSLTPSDIAEGVEIAEDEIRAQYDYQLDLYESPEQRAFEQIVVADEEIAVQIAEAASGGLPLADAIATMDASQVSVIPLELAPRADFLPVLADAGFDLPAGATSAPVKSPFGWHVLQVTEIVEGGIRTYDEVRPEIERELKLEGALDTLFEVANKFDDLLASDLDIGEAADELGLPVTVTSPVARDGSLRNGGVQEGLSSLPQVLATGFTLFEGATSPLEQTADDGYFIVRAEQVIESALRPLDEVRDTVVAGWTAQQTNAAAQALAEATAERLDANHPIADIAAEIGAVTVEHGELRRDGANSGTLPQPLVESVFAAEVGDVALSPTERGYVVARLEAVKPAPASNETELQDIASGQSQAIAGDLLAGFALSLRSEYDVDIDRDSMSRLFQQEPQ